MTVIFKQSWNIPRRLVSGVLVTSYQRNFEILNSLQTFSLFVRALVQNTWSHVISGLVRLQFFFARFSFKHFQKAATSQMPVLRIDHCLSLIMNRYLYERRRLHLETSPKVSG